MSSATIQIPSRTMLERTRLMASTLATTRGELAPPDPALACDRQAHRPDQVHQDDRKKRHADRLDRQPEPALAAGGRVDQGLNEPRQQIADQVEQRREQHLPPWPRLIELIVGSG